VRLQRVSTKGKGCNVASEIAQNSAPNRTKKVHRSYRIRDRLFLKLKRKSRNLTQSDLAAFIGVSRSAVTHWESGANPCIEPIYAERIATLLDEPLKALFSRD
jgi:DNA-binding XRE family transcriptional regulator